MNDEKNTVAPSVSNELLGCGIAETPHGVLPEEGEDGIITDYERDLNRCGLCDKDFRPSRDYPGLFVCDCDDYR